PRKCAADSCRAERMRSSHRGERNEPLFIKYTAEKLAEILGEDLEMVQKRTTENAIKVLNL
ncbi:MAG: TatD family hydrolase, partial [Candidatus Colwellbacteria bacterium]|nr:TatD family hydrolase [Candidatus Colwellbacteria bacterium]